MIAVVACAAALAACGSAAAAEIAFAIPDQPREAALLALARQAGVSLGFAPNARCGGRAGLSGRMTLEAGLARLLAGSPCVARRPDPRTVVIAAAPAPIRSPAGPPAPAAPPGDAALAELVVTADRSEQLLSQSPSGLTALSQAELARAGVSDVHDLSLLAAGVTVTNLGPGRDKVILRGLSDGPLTGHTQSTVGLYLGDLRLTYNAPDPDLPLADLARVEVFRGPQGSLYGAGPIGGVLQFVPNPPDPARRAGSLAATVATTAHGDPTGGVTGMVNQPLAGGRAAVRLVGWSEQAGGVIDDPGRDLADVDRTRRRGLRATGLWRATSDLDLNAMLVSQTIDTRDAHYADPAVGPLSRASAVDQPHDNDFSALALGARWSPAWGQLIVSLGALDHTVATAYDAAAAPPELRPDGLAPETFDDENEIRALVFEARASSAGAGPWRWMLGVFGAVGDQRLDAELTTTDGSEGYAEARRDRLRESAVFGEAAYDLTPALTLTAGGRLFQASLRTRSEVSLGAPVRAFDGATRDTGFAPRLVLAWRPRPGLTFYAQAAEGYRTPGFNTGGPAGQEFYDPAPSGHAYAGQPGPQPFRRYAGDELWSYETGGRWRAPGLGLTSRFAVFLARWRDIQADVLLPSGLPFTANLGDGQSRGVEAEATWVHDGLELRAAAVWQEPELRRPAPGLAGSGDGGLPGMPHLSYAVSAVRTWTWSDDRSLTLRAAYAYVGRSRLAVTAADAPPAAPAMGDYGDLRLAAVLAGSSLSAELFADNLLDGRGDTLAFGNPFLVRTTTVATPQRPRTLGVRLSRRF